MTVGSNIKRLRETQNLTQEELGKIAKVSSMAVSQWENDRATPRMGALQRIADYFGVSKGEIMDDEDMQPLQAGFIRPVKGMDMGYVPLRGKVHAGKPIEAEVYDDEMVLIPQFLIDRDPDCWAGKSEGDCMNNVFPEGAIYVISPNKQHQNGKPEVWTIDGIDTVARRVYQTADTLLLSPDSTNPENKDIVIKADDGHSAKYDGAIVWFQSDGEVE